MHRFRDWSGDRSERIRIASERYRVTHCILETLRFHGARGGFQHRLLTDLAEPVTLPDLVHASREVVGVQFFDRLADLPCLRTRGREPDGMVILPR